MSGRMTRARLRMLASHVIFDEDLLRLVFTHLAISDLEEAQLVCHLWQSIAHESFAAWRRKPGIYLVGGCKDGPHPAQAIASRQVRKYDVNGDSWIPCAPLRKARDHLGLIGWRGRLHALGGWSGRQNRGSCETYDPSEDQWTTSKQRLLTPRSGLSVAMNEDDGMCFAIAGWGGAHLGFLSSVECLQAEAAPPPSPRVVPSSAVSSPASCSCSGAQPDCGSSSSCRDGGASDAFSLPETSTRQARRRGHSGRVRARSSSSSSGDTGASGTSNGSGSDAGCTETSTAHAVEEAGQADEGAPESARSLSLLPMPPTASLRMARHCPAAAALGSFVYLTGGSGASLDPEAASLGAQPTASVERLNLRNIYAGWDGSVASMLSARYRHTVAVLGGKMYVCGGQKIDGRATDSVEVYDPSTDSWREVSPMHHARFSHAMTTLDGRLYVVGGFAHGVWLSSVERYDPETNAWEELSALEGEIAAPGLAVC